MKTIHALIVGGALAAASTTMASAQIYSGHNDATGGGQHISETKAMHGERVRYRDNSEPGWRVHRHHDRRAFGWREPTYTVTYWPFSNFLGFDDDPVWAPNDRRSRVWAHDGVHRHRYDHPARRAPMVRDPSRGANSGS
jgi:hypothetical protein